MRKGGKLFLCQMFVLACTLALLPNITQAAFNGGNEMCLPIADPDPCTCGPKFVPKKGCAGPITKYMCPCWDEANKAKTMGKCMATFKCVGETTEGIDGKQGAVDAGLAKMMEGMLGKLMEALKGGGGGGGGGQQPGQQGPLYPPCVRNAATNTVSPIPCTEANGQINYGGSEGGGGNTTTDGGTLGGSTADKLLDALKGDTDTDDTTGNTKTNTNTNTDTNTNTNTTNTNTSTQNSSTASTTPSTVVQISALGQQKTLTPQVQGVLQSDIIVSGSDGTMFARSRDPQSNTEVAGFYGGSTFGGQASGVIGKLCTSRPWAHGLLGGLLSPGIFDGLCQRFGYQVGEVTVPVQNTTVITPARRPSITITQPRTTQAATTTSQIEPKVDIWANPPAVRLGSRTYIFWTSEGVESCTESGPNFSHNTLSGGASTVPLSDASTFSIECRTSNGRTVTDTVRVSLSL